MRHPLLRSAWLLFLIMISSVIQAQINGKLIDKVTEEPIKNAVVMLLSEKDSILVTFTRSDDKGIYSLTKPKDGNYILSTSHPLYADFVDQLQVLNSKDDQLNKQNKASTQIDITRLTSKSKMLEAIIIKAGGSMKIKGDTTVYTADSFNVSANANVEELLKKLPGIQVDKNGEIKAMGEKVDKVLVDGEEFFGDDPGMAVKNLRADAVKEVQVFDKKSDQAEFTGIDDGKTKKTINLKLKEDKKKGYFGKVSISGGYAPDITNRFNNNLMYGTFKGKRKLSAFVLNGNTGQDGLSWQENQQYGGEESNYEMMDEDGIFSFSFNQGTDDGEINIDTRNGFIRNVNAGLQYSNKWNDKHKLNFTPRYNLQDYTNVRVKTNQTQLGDSAFNSSGTDVTRLNRYNYKNKIVYDASIDSYNSIKMTVNANYYSQESLETEETSTEGIKGNLKNKSERATSSEKEKTTLAGTVLFKHKFRKNRRTLSVNTDWSRTDNQLDRLLNSENFGFSSNPLFTIAQRADISTLTGSLGSKITYTEPLNKKWSMELSYQFNLNNSKNDQVTVNNDENSADYNKVIDTLTNHFDQVIRIHNPSARFSYSYKKYKFNLGSGFGITEFNFIDKTNGKSFDRNYINLFPSATFVYTYKSQHSLRIKYNGSNQQPTINQLQPLRNNTDLFNQTEGNPDLKPSFIHNINLTNNGYNFIQNKWFFQSVNLNITQNSITYNRKIDPVSGATVSRPINTNGNISLSSWMGMGSKWKKYDIQYQVNSNINYTRFADVINSTTSYSKTTSTGISVNLNKSKTEKYDLSFSNNFNFNYNKNAQSTTANKFNTNNINSSFLIYYKKVWSIGADYEYFISGKINQFVAPVEYHIVDLKLQRTFNKNEYTVFIRVKDLLNQNRGIDRSYFGNTFSEERNQRLRRFYMIGVSWDFKNKKK